ncbi:MAG: pyruvate, water dikinase regulatory protein [Myxococcota bacterium]|nr:pyruvate, water dikinase regulatory protein [Myxococcota bacterium]
MPDQHLPMIYIVSDATAETAQRTLRGALMQFRDVETTTRTFTMVRDHEDMVDILVKARERQAFVIFTLINREKRDFFTREAERQGVHCVDLIGELMTDLRAFLGSNPVGRATIRRLTPDYYRRIEAVEFSVKHDDGQMPNELDLADIILVGLSRTSKTPLSTYLAQKGYKVANVPLVLGIPAPPQLSTVDQERVFALTIDAATLMRSRRSRLKALNMPADTDYACREHIMNELDYARDLFDEHPVWPVIDVSQRAIEETAAIITQIKEDRDAARAESAASDASEGAD